MAPALGTLDAFKGADTKAAQYQKAIFLGQELLFAFSPELGMAALSLRRRLPKVYRDYVFLGDTIRPKP